MQEFDISALDELDARFKYVLKKLPQLQREHHERISKMLKSQVDWALGANAGQPSKKVRYWQKERVGSRGGYAAISAKRGSDSRGYAYGYITNAINSGHRHRSPSGKYRYYKPRINVHRVPGLEFYQRAYMLEGK